MIDDEIRLSSAALYAHHISVGVVINPPRDSRRCIAATMKNYVMTGSCFG
jgi:hypothetical protein